MTIGVSFSIANANSKKSLYQILHCVNIPKYFWYIVDSQSEVWNNYLGGNFFRNNYFNGYDFKNKLVSEHYVIFLKLQAYVDNATFTDIKTYDDFLQSDCEILLLIYDCDFVEIYAKDKKLISVFYNNAINNCWESVKYITKSANSRAKMDIL